jgi:hypothetical protein
MARLAMASADEFLQQQIGREQAEVLWKSYPLLEYGKKWDP